MTAALTLEQRQPALAPALLIVLLSRQPGYRALFQAYGEDHAAIVEAVRTTHPSLTYDEALDVAEPALQRLDVAYRLRGLFWL